MDAVIDDGCGGSGVAVRSVAVNVCNGLVCTLGKVSIFATSMLGSRFFTRNKSRNNPLSAKPQRKVKLTNTPTANQPTWHIGTDAHVKTLSFTSSFHPPSYPPTRTGEDVDIDTFFELALRPKRYFFAYGAVTPSFVDAKRNEPLVFPLRPHSHLIHH